MGKGPYRKQLACMYHLPGKLVGDMLCQVDANKSMEHKKLLHLEMTLDDIVHQKPQEVCVRCLQLQIVSLISH